MLNDLLHVDAPASHSATPPPGEPSFVWWLLAIHLRKCHPVLYGALFAWTMGVSVSLMYYEWRPALRNLPDDCAPWESPIKYGQTAWYVAGWLHCIATWAALKLLTATFCRSAVLVEVPADGREADRATPVDAGENARDITGRHSCNA